MSLRSRLLLLFLLLGVVPMLMVGSITSARNIRALEALVGDEVQVIATQVAGETEARLEVQLGLLQFVASNADTRALLAGTDSVPEARAYLTEVLDRLDPEFRSVDVTDRAGRSVLFRGDEVSGGAAPGLGAAFVPRLSEPVPDGEQVLGEVRAAIRPAGLFPEDFADRHFGDRGMTLVVDRSSGRLVHHPLRTLIGADASRVLALAPDSDPPWAQTPGVIRWEARDSSWVAASAPIAGSEWSVVSAAMLSEFDAPFEAAASANAVLLLLIAISAAVVFAWVLARITSSLVELTDSARAVATGNLEPPLPRATGGEVGTLVAAFDTMTRRIEDMLLEVRRSRQLAAVGEFSSEIAHEIRNPLTSVKMNLQGAVRRLEAADPADPNRRPLEIALRETERLQRVVGGVLTLGRIGSGERTRFDVRRLVDGLVDGMTDDHTPGRGSRIRVTGAPGPVEMVADRDAIASAVDNLLRNAREAAGPDGDVEVRLDAEPECVYLHVIDDGPGVPEKLRERIFDPFVTTRDVGNGFGLALATRAIEAHGGTLALLDSDTGAHFEIRLPRDGVHSPMIGGFPNGMKAT